MPVSSAFLYIYFRFSSRGAPLHVPLTDLPQRDAPFPQPSVICLSTVPSKRNPLQVPQWGPFGEICLFPEPSFMCLLDSPVKVLLTEKSHSSLKVPGKGASPPWSPKWDPYGNRHPFPEPYLTYPSGSPAQEPYLQVPLTGLPQRETLSSSLYPSPW